jgi:hypothetical protein
VLILEEEKLERLELERLELEELAEGLKANIQELFSRVAPVFH